MHIEARDYGYNSFQRNGVFESHEDIEASKRRERKRAGKRS
jgi:hypothetical protein